MSDRTTVTLSTGLRDRLKGLRRADGESMHSVIERLVEYYENDASMDLTKDDVEDAVHAAIDEERHRLALAEPAQQPRETE